MTAPNLFDRILLAQRRARATDSGMFLQQLARDEVLERLQSVNRTFTSIAIVTGFPDIWADELPQATLIADADVLDFGTAPYDLIIHAMALHVANDPVGQLIQCKNALKPDGLFMATSLGGQTLSELRTTLTAAEIEVKGGISPRVSPMAELKDMGGLLQRAGLALPVADSLVLPVAHRDLIHLMHDLRDMGETNVMASRDRSFPGRKMFPVAQGLFETDDAGRLLSTFEIIFLSGWAPDESQPKPLRPGSVSKSLLDALEDAKKPPTD